MSPGTFNLDSGLPSFKEPLLMATVFVLDSGEWMPILAVPEEGEARWAVAALRADPSWDAAEYLAW